MAEEVIFGRDQVTTGASSDLQQERVTMGGAHLAAMGDHTLTRATWLAQATKMARSMITQWGMSTTLGPMFYQQREVDNLSPATREVRSGAASMADRWRQREGHIVCCRRWRKR